jgi:DsbC/DsbD-like thiol-disulfide interchange protein
MNRAYFLGYLLAGLVTGLALIMPAQAQDSASKVKATAKASEVGADGKQTVTITIDIDKGWYIYANPVGWKEQEDNHTVVTFKAKDKVSAAVKYPEGVVKTTTDEKKKEVKYRAYEGRVVLQAQLQRTGGDNSPLNVSIGVNACDKDNCLFPGVVKLTVPSTK